MDEINKRATQQEGESDDELPILPDPSLAFWKDNAKALLGESIKSIEETAKQIISVAGILIGLYFHAIAYSNIRGKINGWLVVVYIAPLAFWLVSLSSALLVFFPRTYDTNINSARESRSTFKRLVSYKHKHLVMAGIFLFLGTFGLFAAMGAYLAG